MDTKSVLFVLLHSQLSECDAIKIVAYCVRDITSDHSSKNLFPAGCQRAISSGRNYEYNAITICHNMGGNVRGANGISEAVSCSSDLCGGPLSQTEVEHSATAGCNNRSRTANVRTRGGVALLDLSLKLIKHQLNLVQI